MKKHETTPPSSCSSLPSLNLQKLYNKADITKNKEQLSKVINNKINNLDKAIKSPCSIFLAEESQQSNNFLEDDVYYYLTLHDNQQISVIEESSPKNKKFRQKSAQCIDQFEEIDKQLDYGSTLLDLQVPESIQPKLFSKELN